MSTIDATITSILDDKPEGPWRSRAVAALRPLGAEAIPALERATVAARSLDRSDDWRGPRHIALGLALARIQTDAKVPLSAVAKEEVAADLDRYEDEDLDPSRDLLRDLDEETRGALVTAAVDKGDLHRVAWLAHTFPAALPKLLAVADKMVIGKYDGYKIPKMAGAVATCGAAGVPALVAALPGASNVGAEIIVVALERIADPASAKALVEALGHGAKPVRLGAMAALQKIGAAAKPAVEEGAKSKKKAMREASLELLGALSAERTRADEIHAAASALDEARRTQLLAVFDRCCQANYLPNEPWYAEFAEKLPEDGVPMLAVAAGRHKAEINDYKVRGAYLNTFRALIRMPSHAADAAWVAVRAFSSFPKLSTYTIREYVDAFRQAGAPMVAPLVSLLKGPAFPHRNDAFELLVELDPKADRGIFLAGLSDSSKEVRTGAAKALASFGAEVAGSVAELLGAKKEEVRASAAALLVELASPTARDAIAAALAAEKKAEIAAVLERALAASGGAPAEAAATEAPSGDDEATVVAMLARERKAKLPKFLALEALPALSLRSGATLGGDALLGFVTRLMNEGPDHVDGPARRARKILDDASANTFSVAIKDQWARGGGDSKQKWAIYQQAILASEDRLHEVGPQLDAVVSGGQHHFAGWYVDVLARHGAVSPSTAGLSWIAYWTRHADTKSLRSRVAEALQKAAEERGVTLQTLEAGLNAYVADDVADAKIDPLGLDKAVTLDFGARQFTAHLGQDLELEVRDAAGAVLKALPAAGKKDDADLAKQAKEKFGALKKSLAAVVKDLRARMEEAMISGRPWKQAAFEKLFFHHPIARRFGEDLVWKSGSSTFHVAEGALTDVDDQPVALPEGATIRLAHRLELTDEEIRRWSEHFSDYKVIQPFDQLGRTITAVHDGPLAPKRKMLPTALLGRMRSMGWRRVSVEDAGMMYEAARGFPGRGVKVRLSHEGIHVSDPSWSSDLVGIDGVTFETLAGEHLDQAKVDPIVFSEVARDLDRMVD